MNSVFIKSWISRNRVELLLFVLLFGTYAFFYQSTHHNEASRFDQMRAVIEKHELAINHYWWNTADIIHYPKNGSDRVYPNKAPGMTLLGLIPFSAICAGMSALYHFGLPGWAYWHLVTYLTTLFMVGGLSALAAVAIYRVLKELTGKTYISAMAIIAVWLGTLAFPYSTLFFSHQFVAALLAFAFVCLFWVGRAEASLRYQLISTFGAGLLMSFSVASEYPTILLAAILCVYGAWRIFRLKLSVPERGMFAVTGAVGALFGVAMLLLYNAVAFGKLFYVPYESYARTGADFSATYSHGWLGLHWLGIHPFLHALASITIYPQIGMFYLGIEHWRVYACSPVLWLCVPGLVFMIWKKNLRAEGLLILAMTVAYVVFITSYGTWSYDWAGASYFGCRHMIPLLPFLALPLCFGARILRPIFYPLLAISIFYMLIGTATEPRVAIPYENTARDLLIPDYLRARFAQNTDALFDGQRNLAKDSAAFNIGKLLRLPAHLQLMPLLAWWLIGGAGLLIICRKQDQSARLPEAPADENVGRTPRTFLPPRIALAGLVLFVLAAAVPPIIHHSVASSRFKQHGLLGKYYANGTCTGTPTDVQVDDEINFDWTKSLPMQPPFSIEWTGRIAIERPNNYVFGLIADDGAVLEIDDKVVVDVSKGPILQKQMGSINLSPGLHNVRLKYFNLMFGGLIRWTWIGPAHGEEIVPSEVLIPPIQSR
jgi:hypothetical protein